MGPDTGRLSHGEEAKEEIVEEGGGGVVLTESGGESGPNGATQYCAPVGDGRVTPSISRCESRAMCIACGGGGCECMCRGGPSPAHEGITGQAAKADPDSCARGRCAPTAPRACATRPWGIFYNERCLRLLSQRAMSRGAARCILARPISVARDVEPTKKS